MKRLDIIVEGQSEREFISQMLAPYLERCGVIESYNVSPIVVRTSPNNRGGVSKYTQLRDDIRRSLSSSSQQLIVSMMIDFFRMPQNVPLPENYRELGSDFERADAIQTCICKDINDNRFIPYIQMHEFEAFLFASSEGFRYCYGNDDRRIKVLCDIIEEYRNPEEINTSPDGAPSKRILSVIPEYDKVTDGNLIILQNGMNSIMEKCRRFNKWVELLRMRLEKL